MFRRISYRIVMGANSSNSGKIFTLQKKIVRIMAGAQPRTSCRSLFTKKFEILPVPCQYILSLIKFFANNQETFKTNSSIHNINTRNKHYFHRPNAKLSLKKKKKYILYWHKNSQQFTAQCDNPQDRQGKI